MRHRIASILFFAFCASLALACEAVSHANDFETASQTQTVQSCGVGALECNGVCTTVATDPNNCGACGKACTAGQLCSNGACGSSCTGGLTQCGSTCVDTQNDPDNCGKCGGPDGGGACTICQNGVCRTQCLGGADIKFCKNKKQCVDIKSDPSDCGDCVESGGLICTKDQVCSGGVCESSCGAGLTQCGSACYDLSHDADHCGSCNAPPCPSPLSHGTAVCIPNTNNGFSCGVACDPNFEYCSVAGPEGTTLPSCVDTATDILNCGTCGHRCTSGSAPACQQGTCSN